MEEKTVCCDNCGWKDSYMCDACIEEAMAGKEYMCFATKEELEFCGIPAKFKEGFA